MTTPTAPEAEQFGIVGETNDLRVFDFDNPDMVVVETANGFHTFPLDDVVAFGQMTDDGIDFVMKNGVVHSFQRISVISLHVPMELIQDQVKDASEAIAKWDAEQAHVQTKRDDAAFIVTD